MNKLNFLVAQIWMLKAALVLLDVFMVLAGIGYLLCLAGALYLHPSFIAPPIVTLYLWGTLYMDWEEDARNDP